MAEKQHKLRSSSRSRGIAQLSMIRANRLEAPALVSKHVKKDVINDRENSPSKIKSPLILPIPMSPIRLLVHIMLLRLLLRLSSLPQP